LISSRFLAQETEKLKPGDAESAVGAGVDLVQGDLPLDKLGKIWDLPLLRSTLAYMFGLEELPNPSGALVVHGVQVQGWEVFMWGWHPSEPAQAAH
jgi:hypothetical protein